MEKKKQSSTFAIPFALIGGGIGLFITTSFAAFFIGAAVAVIVGYIFKGMADQAVQGNQDGEKVCRHCTTPPEGGRKCELMKTTTGDAVKCRPVGCDHFEESKNDE